MRPYSDVDPKRTLNPYCRRASRTSGAGRSAACGAVTFQRCVDALDLNVHFRSLVLDGVYLEGEDGGPRFRPLPADSTLRVFSEGALVSRILCCAIGP